MSDDGIEILTMEDMPKDPIERPSRQIQTQPDTESWVGTFVDYRTICKYDFLDDAYTGAGGFSGLTKSEGRKRAKSYLTPNPTERFYLTRVRTSVYTNHFAKSINSQILPIFAQKPIETTVVDTGGRVLEGHPYSDFLADIDGAGTKKNQFLKVAMGAAYRHGVAFAVMDKLPGALRPIAYLMDADDVQDYGTDKAGGLAWIAFKDGEMHSAEGKEIPLRLLIDKNTFRREYWDERSKSWVLVDEQPNTTGILPVMPIFGQIRDDASEYLPEPAMYPIAQICHWIYDKESNLDWLIQKQAHDIIVVNGDIEGIGRPTDNALVIPASDQKLFAPFALSPDADKARVHQERIDRKLEDLADLVSQNGVVAQATSVQSQSGVSKSYSFIATNDKLKAGVNLCKEIEEWLKTTYRAFMDEVSAAWTIRTDYPADFQPKPTSTTTDTIETANAYQGAGLALCWREEMKALVYLQNPSATSEQLAARLAEIDAAPLPGAQ